MEAEAGACEDKKTYRYIGKTAESGCYPRYSTRNV